MIRREIFGQLRFSSIAEGRSAVQYRSRKFEKTPADAKQRLESNITQVFVMSNQVGQATAERLKCQNCLAGWPGRICGQMAWNIYLINFSGVGTYCIVTTGYAWQKISSLFP